MTPTTTTTSVIVSREKKGLYLEGGDDFITDLLDRNHVAAGLRVDDALFLLPAHHDGFLTVGRAAHLLLFALRGQRGVGVGRYHGRNCGGNESEEERERVFLSLFFYMFADW